jgi:hypothetical protein
MQTVTNADEIRANGHAAQFLTRLTVCRSTVLTSVGQANAWLMFISLMSQVGQAAAVPRHADDRTGEVPP